MADEPTGANAGTGADELSDDSALRNDPVLQGHSALNDPDLSGSTTSSWSGTGGPDPGGMAGPAELDDQGNQENTGGGSPS